MAADVSGAGSLLIAFMFVVAAGAKLRVLQRFVDQVQDYGLLPPRFGTAVAVLVPVGEVAGAALIVVPSTRVAGAGVLMALLAIFSAAVGINLRRGNTEISCACFGAAEKQHLSYAIPVRNGVLGAILATTLVVGSREMPSVAAWMTAVLGGLLLWLAVEAIGMFDSSRRLDERAREVLQT